MPQDYMLSRSERSYEILGKQGKAGRTTTTMGILHGAYLYIARQLTTTRHNRKTQLVGNSETSDPRSACIATIRLLYRARLSIWLDKTKALPPRQDALCFSVCYHYETQKVAESSGWKYNDATKPLCNHHTPPISVGLLF